MTKQDRWFSGDTLVHWTCKALINRRAISHRTEIREIRGWRLGAIIHRLRWEFHWPIEADYKWSASVAHYRLVPRTEVASLKFTPSSADLGADIGILTLLRMLGFCPVVASRLALAFYSGLLSLIWWGMP